MWFIIHLPPKVGVNPTLWETPRYRRGRGLCCGKRQLVIREMRTRREWWCPGSLREVGVLKGMYDAVENSGRGLWWLTYWDVSLSNNIHQEVSALWRFYYIWVQPVLTDQHIGIDDKLLLDMLASFIWNIYEWMKM